MMANFYFKQGEMNKQYLHEWTVQSDLVWAGSLCKIEREDPLKMQARPTQELAIDIKMQLNYLHTNQ